MIASPQKVISNLTRTRLELIDACGRLSQLLGVPRSVGQIYGLLYLSSYPLSLDDITESLGISKASASVGTRQLLAWGGIRQVWVPGERRDHYQAEPELANLLRSSYAEFLKPRLVSSRKRLEQLVQTLEEELDQGVLTRDEYKFCAERLKKFSQVQKKLQMLVPLAEKLF